MSMVIFDIEISDDVDPYHNREIIEIKAVKLLDNGSVDYFQTYIKPEYVDSLSEYCQERTGITMEMLSEFPHFNHGVLEFYNFIYGSNILSFGEQNRKLLIGELKEKGYGHSHLMIENAVRSSHVNIQKCFYNIAGVKVSSVSEALAHLGVKRIDDDLENIVNLYLELEELRVAKANEIPEKRMREIIESIESGHGKGTRSRNIMKFIDEWVDLILVDHQQDNTYLLTTSEISILKKIGGWRMESGNLV